MNHSQAKELVERTLPELTPAESLFLRANAWFETGYGRKWTGAGAGSHNWGSVTMKKVGECEGGFPHRDSYFDRRLGKKVHYVTCFRSYPDDAAGIRHMAKVLFKDNVRQAMERGDLEGGSAAMRTNKYYLGVQPTVAESVAVHHHNIKSIVKSIKEATGELDPFVRSAPPEGPEPSLSSPADTSPTGPFARGSRDLPDLRWGNTGSAVGLWQRILGGYYNGALDDEFGPVTHQATCEWQARHDLEPDGWVGPFTWGEVANGEAE